MRLKAALASAVFVGSQLLLTGCGGHEARSLPMRTALDAGDPHGAIAAIDKELGVEKPTEYPKDVEGDNALFVLDRASVQQSIANFTPSEQDFQVADKAIDMLDLARNASDSIGEYIFSDSAGRYKAPPYEKLLINTLNMVNYLETHDLNGALIEARRLSVMQRYFKEDLKEEDNAILGVGGVLAGFAFEKHGDTDEALRYYDEALAFGELRTLRDPVRRLLQRGSAYRSPRLEKLAAEGSSTSSGNSANTETPENPAQNPPQPAPEDDTGEVLFIVGYGRVPHKIAKRIPIGLALTLVAGDISPNDRSQANELAAQGLVTWVNYPTLAPGRGDYATPTCQLDGQYVQLEQAVDVSEQVRREWSKIEGKVILSAITRLIARVAVGQGIQAAAGKKNELIGVLASLGAQATLTALDTPDTRSWETLPARIAVARVKLPAGRHSVYIDARGWERRQEIVVTKGGWNVVSLMALR